MKCDAQIKEQMARVRKGNCVRVVYRPMGWGRPKRKPVIESRTSDEHLAVGHRPHLRTPHRDGF